MAIINKCPLTGIATITESIIDFNTGYLHHLLSLPIKELVTISNAAEMPSTDNLVETKLLFCAFAKQANLLSSNRQILYIDNKVIVTHFKLLQSLAIYINKEPRFAQRIPKYAHYTHLKADNFGYYLELLKKEKDLYIEERKELKQKYKDQETILQEIAAIDIAETKLGIMASKYAAKLNLSIERNSSFSMGKEIAGYLLVAMKLNTDMQLWYKYLMCGTIHTLHQDSEVKEIDLVDLIEDLEAWDTGLSVKYVALKFLRAKLAKFNNYSGKKVSKIDISELDFLLGDIELLESNTVESTRRSELNTQVTNSQVTNSTNFDNPLNSTNFDNLLLSESSVVDTTMSNHKEDMANKIIPSKSTATSLAASILAKIATKKKGN